MSVKWSVWKDGAGWWQARCPATNYEACWCAIFRNHADAVAYAVAHAARDEVTC